MASKKRQVGKPKRVKISPIIPLTVSGGRRQMPSSCPVKYESSFQSRVNISHRDDGTLDSLKKHLQKVNSRFPLTPWFYNQSNQDPFTSVADKISSPFQIRPASTDELTGVAQIIAESFHSQKGLWGLLFPLLRLGIYEDLRHRLASSAPHHICLVAVDTNENESNNLVGSVELGVRFSDPWTQTGKSFPYLSNLAVNPKYRRRGVASNLLRSCDRVALAWGFQDLYVPVLENNHQARPRYFKQG